MKTILVKIAAISVSLAGATTAAMVTAIPSHSATADTLTFSCSSTSVKGAPRVTIVGVQGAAGETNPTIYLTTTPDPNGSSGGKFIVGGWSNITFPSQTGANLEAILNVRVQSTGSGVTTVNTVTKNYVVPCA